VSARMKAKYFGAITGLLWGRMFVERRGDGDADKARDLLTKAHLVATANGYRNVERRAAGAIQDLN
jgi:hypothetical protein